MQAGIPKAAVSLAHAKDREDKLKQELKSLEGALEGTAAAVRTKQADLDDAKATLEECSYLAVGTEEAQEEHKRAAKALAAAEASAEQQRSVVQQATQTVQQAMRESRTAEEAFAAAAQRAAAVTTQKKGVVVANANVMAKRADVLKLRAVVSMMERQQADAAAVLKALEACLVCGRRSFPVSTQAV